MSHAREALEQRAPTYEPGSSRFLGHDGRACGEHRTAIVRAWCFDCAEWCSAKLPCEGCDRPTRAQLREALRAVLDLHQQRENECTGRQQCGYCADLCHSFSGLQCEEVDAAWPCETVRRITDALTGGSDGSR